MADVGVTDGRSRRRALALLVALASLAAAVWFLFLRPSDEERIRRKLATLVEAVHALEAGSGGPAQGREPRFASSFARVFAPRVEVDIDGASEGSMRREQLAGEALAVAGAYRPASFALTQIVVKVADPPTSARVTGVASVTRVEDRREKRTFEMRLAKTDGEWWIASVSTAPPEEASASRARDEPGGVRGTGD